MAAFAWTVRRAGAVVFVARTGADAGFQLFPLLMSRDEGPARNDAKLSLFLQ
jgi:hypothetical protein